MDTLRRAQDARRGASASGEGVYGTVTIPGRSATCPTVGHLFISPYLNSEPPEGVVFPFTFGCPYVNGAGG
jgi:hypothetical protein